MAVWKTFVPARNGNGVRIVDMYKCRDPTVGIGNCIGESACTSNTCPKSYITLIDVLLNLPDTVAICLDIPSVISMANETESHSIIHRTNKFVVGLQEPRVAEETDCRNALQGLSLLCLYTNASRLTVAIRLPCDAIVLDNTALLGTNTTL